MQNKFLAKLNEEFCKRDKALKAHQVNEAFVNKTYKIFVLEHLKPLYHREVKFNVTA